MGRFRSNRLADALRSNDHAEAWYAIRYASGSDARRRYLDSEEFGLYNDSPTEVDYKAAYRMLTRHRETILGSDTIGGTADDYDFKNSRSLQNATATQLRDLIATAASQLTKVYIDDKSVGIAVSWDHIYVGEDKSSSYFYKTDADAGNHVLKGTSERRSDLRRIRQR